MKDLKTFLPLIIVSLILSACATPSSSSYSAIERNYEAHNYKRAFQDLWGPAMHEQPWAMYAVGYMYYYGIGTEKDQGIGYALIRRAAELNYPPAIVAQKALSKERGKQYLSFENIHKRKISNNEGILELKTTPKGTPE